MAVEADSLYRQLLAILGRSRAHDRELVSVLGDYSWLLRQTGRRREAKKLESRASEIAAMYPVDLRCYTVDISDLLRAH
jgi:hypothetical protein